MNCLQRGIGLEKSPSQAMSRSTESVEATKMKKETPIMPVRKTIITSPIVRGAWLLLALMISFATAGLARAADPKSPLPG